LVVSLGDSPRRDGIAARLDELGLPFEFVEGVRFTDRKHLPRGFDEGVAAARFGRQLTLAEIGCTAAHRGLHARIARSSWNAAIILEDDARLSDSFADVICDLLPQIDQGDVVLLCHWGEVRPSRFRAVQLRPPFKLVYVHRRSPLGTVGYVVSRCASRALAAARIDQASSTADDWEHAGTSVVLRAVMPTPVEHDLTLESEISAARFEGSYSSPPWPVRVSFKLRELMNATGPIGRLMSDVALEVANAVRRLRFRSR
jgi:glycosyl transferase family 25